MFYIMYLTGMYGLIQFHCTRVLPGGTGVEAVQIYPKMSWTCSNWCECTHGGAPPSRRVGPAHRLPYQWDQGH